MGDVTEVEEQPQKEPKKHSKKHRPRSDVPFYTVFACLAVSYLALIVAMILADLTFTSWADFRALFSDPYFRYSAITSFVTCTITAIGAVIVAVPTGYLLSRSNFRGKNVLDAILDIPIVLPPLVVGLSLLVLFRSDTAFGRFAETSFLAIWNGLGLNALFESLGLSRVRGIAYEIPSIVLAQFAVSTAFAIRTMRLAFDELDPRPERVAWTLGCNRAQAFRRVVLPAAWPGVVSAGGLAWARAMGEFGPILVFAGTTRLKTEVMPTTIFLELSVGDVEGAVAVSLFLVTTAVVVLIVARSLGLRQGLL